MNGRRRPLLPALVCALVAGTAGATSDFVYSASRSGAATRAPARRGGPPPVTRDAAGFVVPRGLSSDPVTIECSDGYRLGASLIKRARVNGKLPGVIFLHDVGVERHDFFPLTVQTAARNCAVLSLDLRGHGENPKLEGNPPRTASQLTDADWAAMLDDVRNAISFLAIKNDVEGGRIALIGSGLGADLALVAAAQSWAAPVICVIALSPSAADHGLTPVASAGKIPSDTSVYLVASKGDTASHDAAVAILRAVRGPKELLEPEGAARGRLLLGQGVNGRIPAWLFGTLQPPTAAGAPRNAAVRRPARP